MSRDTPYTGDYSVTYHYNDDAGNTSGLRSKAMERRDFIKMTGAAAAAAAATGIAGGCASKVKNSGNDKAGSAGDNGMAGGGMTYRTDPKFGEKVSVLGYGCMRWQMTKDENGKDIIDQESVNELVDYALARGVNYFDSSPVYLQGQSEAASGLALSRHPRDSYYIATKLSNFSDWSRENSLLMYHKSFENFRTDHLDYYLLHSVGKSMEDFENRYIDNGMLDFLLKEREKGRIGHLGFSFHGKREMFDELLKTHGKYHWDFIQIQMNYRDWSHAEGNNCNADHMYGELEKRGIPVVIMEPLRGGSLAKLPNRIVDELKERMPSESVASWAFRFAGTPENVLTVLSGMTYMEHLQDNLRTYSPLVPLTADDMVFLEKVAESLSKYPLVPCTGCQYCMPCPYGIDIPGNFSHYNKCVNEGYTVSEPDVDSDECTEEMKAYRRARRAYLVSYDRSIEKIRQANRCIGCGQCISHCPQDIKIPSELHRIDHLVENLRRHSDRL